LVRAAARQFRRGGAVFPALARPVAGTRRGVMGVLEVLIVVLLVLWLLGGFVVPVGGSLIHVLLLIVVVLVVVRLLQGRSI
jgi:hypothetical protein